MHKHSVALDMLVIMWLIVALLGNLASWAISGWPWGWLAIGMLSGAILMRTWNLAWERGHTKALRECTDLIARQNAMLSMQEQALRNSVKLPAVVLDDETKQVTIRMSICPN
jgi:hypothetical protein